jgi:hypothetical protein
MTGTHQFLYGCGAFSLVMLVGIIAHHGRHLIKRGRD